MQYLLISLFYDGKYLCKVILRANVYENYSQLAGNIAIKQAMRWERKGEYEIKLDKCVGWKEIWFCEGKLLRRVSLMIALKAIICVLKWKMRYVKTSDLLGAIIQLR